MTIGTKRLVGIASDTISWPSRMWRHHPQTCCGHISHRRTRLQCLTDDPDLLFIRPRRRRPDPVRTSIRRNPAFASSLIASIATARCLNWHQTGHDQIDKGRRVSRLRLRSNRHQCNRIDFSNRFLLETFNSRAPISTTFRSV